MAAAAKFLRNVAAAAAFALLIATADAYTNYTVGGDSGWFFNAATNTSSTNFTDWAASQTFGLGDYLSKLQTLNRASSSLFFFLLLLV